MREEDCGAVDILKHVLGCVLQRRWVHSSAAAALQTMMMNDPSRERKNGWTEKKRLDGISKKMETQNTCLVIMLRVGPPKTETH